MRTRHHRAFAGPAIIEDKDRNFNRITCRGRDQTGVLGGRVGPGKGLGGSASGQSTVVERDDERVCVPVLGEPSKSVAVEPAGGARQTQPGVCAGLPAQALIEDEVGHGRRGLIPVGHRLG